MGKNKNNKSKEMPREEPLAEAAPAEAEVEPEVAEAEVEEPFAGK